MILALWLSASAHGPASALLEVLAWDEAGCERVPAGRAPRLVRANFGVLQHDGTGQYRYGCPSRWGGAERALVAFIDGQMVASGNSGTFLSLDEGCTASQVGVTPGQTPLEIAAWSGAAWLVTRDFDAGGAALWRIDRDGAVEVPVLGEGQPDSVLGGPDGLWLAGHSPAPFLWWTDGTVVEDRTPASWPATAAPMDWLALRRVTEGEVWLTAGTGSTRRFWRVADGEVTVPMPDAGILHGPAARGDDLLAVVDGVLWTRGVEGAWTAGVEVDWTCLHELDGATVACALDEVRLLGDGAPPSEEVVMSLVQVGEPDVDACDAAGGQCSLDWLHFGGESGWIDTLPDDCPDGERTVKPPTVLPPGDEGCEGCSGGGAPGGGVAVGLAFWARRRRWRGASVG